MKVSTKKILFDLLPLRMYLELIHFIYRNRRKQQFSKSQSRRKIITDSGYSYKPFDDSKAIFIHIPKCAGVSINRALFGNLAGGHATLEEYIHVFEPESIQNYFKFTIVRNPWDRLVSAYHFLKKGGFGQKDKNWFDAELACYKNFDEFVKEWLSKENIWKWHHFRPQYNYMLDHRQRVKLDFLGFYETIEVDFELIKNRLGINSKLPKSNMGRHDGYMKYYNDETKEIVSFVYSEDIKLLGYNFDNSSINNQILRRNDNVTFRLNGEELKFIR